MGNDPEGEEEECQTFALLTQPETKRVVLRRKDGEKLRKFDSDTDTALLDTDRSTQDTLF